MLTDDLTMEKVEDKKTCLFCRVKLSPSTAFKLRDGLDEKTVTWEEKCAEAICEIFFGDPTHPLKIYFQNAAYCSGCQVIIWDLEFCWRQLLLIRSQVDSLSLSLRKLLMTNFRAIRLKTRVVIPKFEEIHFYGKYSYDLVIQMLRKLLKSGDALSGLHVSHGRTPDCPTGNIRAQERNRQETSSVLRKSKGNELTKESPPRQEGTNAVVTGFTTDSDKPAVVKPKVVNNCKSKRKHSLMKNKPKSPTAKRIKVDHLFLKNKPSLDTPEPIEVKKNRIKNKPRQSDRIHKKVDTSQTSSENENQKNCSTELITPTDEANIATRSKSSRPKNLRSIRKMKCLANDKEMRPQEQLETASKSTGLGNYVKNFLKQKSAEKTVGKRKDKGDFSSKNSPKKGDNNLSTLTRTRARANVPDVSNTDISITEERMDVSSQVPEESNSPQWSRPLIEIIKSEAVPSPSIVELDICTNVDEDVEVVGPTEFFLATSESESRILRSTLARKSQKEALKSKVPAIKKRARRNTTTSKKRDTRGTSKRQKGTAKNRKGSENYVDKSRLNTDVLVLQSSSKEKAASLTKANENLVLPISTDDSSINLSNLNSIRGHDDKPMNHGVNYEDNSSTETQSQINTSGTSKALQEERGILEETADIPNQKCIRDVPHLETESAVQVIVSSPVKNAASLPHPKAVSNNIMLMPDDSSSDSFGALHDPMALMSSIASNTTADPLNYSKDSMTEDEITEIEDNCLPIESEMSNDEDICQSPKERVETFLKSINSEKTSPAKPVLRMNTLVTPSDSSCSSDEEVLSKQIDSPNSASKNSNRNSTSNDSEELIRINKILKLPSASSSDGSDLEDVENSTNVPSFADKCLPDKRRRIQRSKRKRTPRTVLLSERSTLSTDVLVIPQMNRKGKDVSPTKVNENLVLTISTENSPINIGNVNSMRGHDDTPMNQSVNYEDNSSTETPNQINTSKTTNTLQEEKGILEETAKGIPIQKCIKDVPHLETDSAVQIIVSSPVKNAASLPHPKAVSNNIMLMPDDSSSDSFGAQDDPMALISSIPSNVTADADPVNCPKDSITEAEIEDNCLPIESEMSNDEDIWQSSKEMEETFLKSIINSKKTSPIKPVLMMDTLVTPSDSSSDEDVLPKQKDSPNSASKNSNRNATSNDSEELIRINKVLKLPSASSSDGSELDDVEHSTNVPSFSDKCLPDKRRRIHRSKKKRSPLTVLPSDRSTLSTDVLVIHSGSNGKDVSPRKANENLVLPNTTDNSPMHFNNLNSMRGQDDKPMKQRVNYEDNSSSETQSKLISSKTTNTLQEGREILEETVDIPIQKCIRDVPHLETDSSVQIIVSSPVKNDASLPNPKAVSNNIMLMPDDSSSDSSGAQDDPVALISSIPSNVTADLVNYPKDSITEAEIEDNCLPIESEAIKDDDDEEVFQSPKEIEETFLKSSLHNEKKKTSPGKPVLMMDTLVTPSGSSSDEDVLPKQKDSPNSASKNSNKNTTSNDLEELIRINKVLKLPSASSSDGSELDNVESPTLSTLIPSFPDNSLPDQRSRIHRSKKKLSPRLTLPSDSSSDDDSDHEKLLAKLRSPRKMINKKKNSSTSRGTKSDICLVFGCGLSFSSTADLIQHFQITHKGPNKPYQCVHPGCGKRFFDADSLSSHAKTHTRRRRWKRCIECTLRFRNEDELTIHRYRDHRKSLYKCTICFETFKNVQLLNSHNSKVHTYSPDAEKEKFSCTYCKKEFSTQKTLEFHMKSHLETCRISQQKCDLCGIICTDQKMFEEHEKLHEKERPFKCQICGDSFAWRFRLKAHLVSHLQEPTVTCSICGKGFNSEITLKVHESVHVKPEDTLERTGCLKEHSSIVRHEESDSRTRSDSD